MCISLSPNPEMQSLLSSVSTQKRTCYVMQRTGSVKQKTDAKRKNPIFFYLSCPCFLCVSNSKVALCSAAAVGWDGKLSLIN